jgi:hypothetical protein
MYFYCSQCPAVLYRRADDEQGLAGALGCLVGRLRRSIDAHSKLVRRLSRVVSMALHAAGTCLPRRAAVAHHGCTVLRACSPLRHGSRIAAASPRRRCHRRGTPGPAASRAPDAQERGMEPKDGAPAQRSNDDAGCVRDCGAASQAFCSSASPSPRMAWRSCRRSTTACRRCARVCGVRARIA